MTAEREWPVRITSMDVVRQDNARYLRVTVTVERSGATDFTVPFLLPYSSTDDASVVPLVRNYFHRSMKLLADQTADWEISPEEIATLRGDK